MFLRPRVTLALLIAHTSSILHSITTVHSFPTTELESLLSRAKSYLDVDKDAEAAFGVLAQVYQNDPTAKGLTGLFEKCFRLRIKTTTAIEATAQDRFGLAALLLDQERYDEASEELRVIVEIPELPSHVHEKAASMLFRTNAACCQWDSVAQDSRLLMESLRLAKSDGVPVLHPFEALKWPCVSLDQATKVACLYARRAMLTQGQEWIEPSLQHKRDIRQVSRGCQFPTRTLKLGYISPDFTSTHPLAFLMQDVFRHHNRDHVEVNLYSLSKSEECTEVNAIREGSDSFKTLSRTASAKELAEIIRNDDLDVLVDLCGYAGTTLVAEILAHRPAPVQVSYMGFPGSSGAPYLDYLVCDTMVVPPELRHHYTEKMIWMPHCYFVNSHKQCVPIQTPEEQKETRLRYGLQPESFVFCCHSRPDKIDPSVFHTWMKAMVALKNENVVLWLLQSGSTMEKNLRQIAEQSYDLPRERLVFCQIAPREEHLQRLGCADIFLDTPAYNAHTLGCDALWTGVPMISLLQPLDHKSEDGVYGATEKLASRVGASLLTACGLNEFIVPDLVAYEAMMVKAASERKWFSEIQMKLTGTRMDCPLFDTKLWVENLELALREVGLKHESRTADIRII